jgi:hypothetical protein
LQWLKHLRGIGMSPLQRSDLSLRFEYDHLGLEHVIVDRLSARYLLGALFVSPLEAWYNPERHIA